MRTNIGALAALAVSAGAVQAQVYDKWNIGAFVVEETRTGCLMTARAEVRDARLPIYLTLSAEAPDGLRVAIHSSDWAKLETGRAYPIEIAFLGTETIHDVTALGVGIRGDNGLLFAPDGDWIEDFQTATEAVFVRDGAILGRFDVTGAHPAFRRLEGCFVERTTAIAAESEYDRRNPRDPFAD